MTRLIDADALIEKYIVVIRKDADEKLKTEIAVLLKDIDEQPTVETDMSEYSDRLYKLAYERGKAEAVIRCKDCKYGKEDEDGTIECTFWDFMDHTHHNDPEGFCYRAERRGEE